MSHLKSAPILRATILTNILVASGYEDEDGKAESEGDRPESNGQQYSSGHNGE